MPPGPRSAPRGGVEARTLDSLLRDLGPLLRRAEVPRDPPGRCPTGLPEVDRVLEGGFPRGRLSEIAGPASSGRTSLALSLLAATTRTGELAALVDACDAFAPPTAEAAGVDLSRVLWVRAPERKAALRSAERLLEARGFALVLLDLADHAGERPRRAASIDGHVPRGETRHVPRATWPRLVRAAASTSTACVVIGSAPLAGTFATLTLALDPARPRFSGVPPLFEGLEGRLLLVRNRTGPSDRSASLRLGSPDRAA